MLKQPLNELDDVVISQDLQSMFEFKNSTDFQFTDVCLSLYFFNL
jgi:hypothetical protein